MQDANDLDLLREYDRNGSEAAFSELVRRHVNLVYSVALRHVGIAAQAEEITQAVFIILARKAASLRQGTVLEGWLCATTRLTALSFLRGERRRQFREQEAYMQSTLQEPGNDAVWNQMSPLLDEAIAQLGTKDRDAVVLRFFKEKSLREVAAALNVNEGAAQRRVLRAMEKLRKFFAKQGIDSTAAILGGAISMHSIQAAPAALAKSATSMALAKGAAAGSTLTLIQGVLKIMAWTKAKTAIAAGVSVLLLAGTAALIIKERPHGSDLPALQGKWTGRETGVPGSASLVVSGSSLEFHGADPSEWYKGSLVLHEDINPKRFDMIIAECPAPQYVGKTGHGIYKIQDGTLTMAGNEPGDPNFPASFQSADARTMVFKKQ
jgi:RNA polymerase sigma factor (sigma-70 family)